ncbi:MAG: dienelactone hydrolase family protein [Candidatus Dormibacteraeota bacterium]|nr:dienelactone hydrolase family protein [Candidatus Dormibacteraeota bacterium]
MCYSNQARPPLPPILGGSRDDRELVLTANDGNRLGAYAVRAIKPIGAGIVIMPDVRGLHPFYKELARQFAGTGVDAVAIDYFGRTAGIGERADDFDFKTHIPQTRPEHVSADVAAGIEYLKSADGGAAGALFTVGFCFGGGMSWRQSAAQAGLSGAIGFYGRPSVARDAIPGMKAPLLLLIAGDDQATPQEEFVKFDHELTDARVPHQKVVYQGAPHSFFDRSFEQHKDACEDAWRQMLSFIGERRSAHRR